MLCSNGAAQTIELYRGDSLQVEFDVTWENNEIADLTGYSARFRVLRGSAVIFTKDSAHSGEVVFVEPRSSGKFRVVLLPADTAALQLNYDFSFDAEIYDGSNVYTVAAGVFRVI